MDFVAGKKQRQWRQRGFARRTYLCAQIFPRNAILTHRTLRKSDMIQEFKVKNYLSFRDEATFSFLATDDRSFGEDQVVTIGKTRLLRFAIVYGANASGKSNLLTAFDFLRSFWSGARESDEESTGTVPFLLDLEQQTPSEPSSFELIFFVGETKYRYVLTLDPHRVHEETLYYYKTSRATRLFHRSLEDGSSVIKLSSEIKVSPAVLEELTAKCLPNMSFFAARARVNASLPLIDDVREWMREQFFPPIGPKTKLSDYFRRKVLKDADLKDYLLDIIQRADFNITGINAEKKSLSEKEKQDFFRGVPFPFSDDFKKLILSEKTKAERTSLEFVHTVKGKQGEEAPFSLPESAQSAGTQRILGVETAIYEVEKRNGFLAIDEIESSLHPELVELILDQYLNSEGRSQLLVTTHYDPLLDNVDSYFRKDSVWFTEKGEDGNTSLYSLVEFRRLSQIHSFQGAYRNGRFGALPNTY